MYYQAGYNQALVFRDDPEPRSWLQGITSKGGQLPAFFIAGAQKSGTTSLFAALAGHPSILMPRLKEPFYYGNDLRYTKGLPFYEGNFPEKTSGRFYVDASTNYFDHPQAAERIRKDVPDAKVILLLRNPVERAYSHYRMQVENKIEELSFEEALDREEERINEGRKISPRHNYCYQRLGYRVRGEYSRMLPTWTKTFGADQLLVLSAEEFFHNTSDSYQNVLAFLGLEKHEPSDFPLLNAGKKNEMSTKARASLEEHFAPFNLELERQLQRSFNWGDR